MAQLLERIKQGSPAAFERLVIDVLVAMGYGGAGNEKDLAQEKHRSPSEDATPQKCERRMQELS